MINASGANGVPITPAQPTVGATPVVPAAPTMPPVTPALPPTPVAPPQPVAPIAPGIPQAPITPRPATPVSPTTPATTPITPPTAPAGTAGGSMKMPGKKLPMKLIIGVVVLVLLLVGGIAAYLLSQVSQDVRQQASEELYNPQVCIADQFGGSASLYAQNVTSCTNSGGTWVIGPTSCRCDSPTSAKPKIKVKVYHR